MAAQPRVIDVLHRGTERVIGCWDLGGALVDPGPESCMETLLDRLGAEPRALLLTHIHLDHAGASGALVERFPELEVWVHAKGAPHLADPAKLMKSAERIYGDRMKPLWGRIVPVPERNLRILQGGETIAIGGRELEVEYTPGHASHHVVYFDRSDGAAYVGDVAGVRIPPTDFIRAPTPPPDIDVELWERSIDIVRERKPSRLGLTHFGAVDDPEPHLERRAARDRALRADRGARGGLEPEVPELRAIGLRVDAGAARRGQSGARERGQVRGLRPEAAGVRRLAQRGDARRGRLRHRTWSP
jgi:glyoxylase-like metal-dependent hydrolase (beta-lactamase superfamily II)